MKKLICAFVISFFCSITSEIHSQSATTLDKGKIFADVYYGYNLITYLLENDYANSGNATNISISGIGPIGVRMGYMVVDNFSIGVDVNYANSKISWNDISGSGSGIIYYYKLEYPRIRVMVDYQYHFVRVDNFDAYCTLKAGYANWTANLSTNDPNFRVRASSIYGVLPVAFRVGVGVRYFFTDFLGANMDIGFFGGGAIQGGLSFKF